MNKCPLCSDIDTILFHEDKKRSYMRCNNCKLVFVPHQFWLNAVDEKSEYDLHVNNPEDQGYRKFLSRLSNPLLEKLETNKKGLDFGCGPGPTLSVIMEESGHKVDLYDLYYFQDDSVLKHKYDFITSTEVVEHLQNPRDVFSDLFKMLHPGSYLGLMTKMVKDIESFKSWHYIQDPTHICFYSRETFEYIADLYSAELEFIGNDVVLFHKK